MDRGDPGNSSEPAVVNLSEHIALHRQEGVLMSMSSCWGWQGYPSSSAKLLPAIDYATRAEGKEFLARLAPQLTPTIIIPALLAISASNALSPT